MKMNASGKLGSKTLKDIAEELGTDPKSILIHIHMGEKLIEHVRYLQSLPTVKEIAKQFNVTPSTIRRAFEDWTSEKGLSTSHFILYDRVKSEGFVFVRRRLHLPKEFVEWFEERHKRSRMHR